MNPADRIFIFEFKFHCKRDFVFQSVMSILLSGKIWCHILYSEQREPLALYELAYSLHKNIYSD